MKTAGLGLASRVLIVYCFFLGEGFLSGLDSGRLRLIRGGFWTTGNWRGEKLLEALKILQAPQRANYIS